MAQTERVQEGRKSADFRILERQVTGGGIRDYELLLGMDRKVLRGKEMLDIGAGEGNFGKECRQLGINVVSIDPMYDSATLEDWKKEQRNGGRVPVLPLDVRETKNFGEKLAGIHQALPFRNDSFDAIVSRLSAFYTLSFAYEASEVPEPETRMIRGMITETIRVLKPGGEALLQMTGIVYKDDSQYMEVVARTLNAIRKEGAIFSWDYRSGGFEWTRGPIVLAINKW